MKKIFFIIVMILVLIAAGVAGYYLFLQKKQVAIESVLPQGALFYAQTPDVQKHLEYFSSTEFGKGLAGINYEKIIERSSLGEDQKKHFLSFLKQWSNPKTQDYFKKIFGRDVAMAVYPTSFDFSTIPSDATVEMIPKILEEIFADVFLVTRVAPEVQVAESFSGFLTQMSTNVNVQTSDYKGQKIYSVLITDQNLKVSFTRIKDLVVIGVGEKAVQKSIDLSGQKNGSLSDDVYFKQARAGLFNEKQVGGYWNMEEFYRLVFSKFQEAAKVMDEDVDVVSKQLDEVIQKVGGFKSFAYVIETEPLLKLKIRVQMDKSKMDSSLAQSFSACQNIDNKTIGFTPKEVLAYHWSACFDWSYNWNEFKKEIAKATEDAPHSKNIPSVTEQIKALEENLGLSIDNDILPAFGDELGGYLEDIQTGAMMPIPKLLVFLEVNNEDKAKQVITKLLEKSPVMFQAQDYSGRQIYSLGINLGDLVQPSYCFLDNYLVVAINPQMIKNSIDALGDTSKSLVSNEKFKEVSDKLASKAMSLQFFQVGEIVNALSGLIEMSNSMAAAKDQKALAFRNGSMKRLEDLRNKMIKNKEFLEEKQSQLETIEAEIINLKTQLMPVDVKEGEKKSLEKDIENIQKDLAAEIEEEKELNEIVAAYQEPSFGVEDRRFYLDELIYPLLRAVESIKTLVTHSTVSEEGFEATTLMKVK